MTSDQTTPALPGALLSPNLKAMAELTDILHDRDETLIKERDELKVLNRIISGANRSTTGKELFENTLPHILNAFGFCGGLAYLVNPKTRVAKIAYHIGADDWAVEKFKTLQIDEEPQKLVFNNGEPFIVENLQSRRPDGTYGKQIKSLISYPIRSPCGIVGAIALFSKTDAIISDETKISLPAISSYLGDALRRIWAEQNLIKEANKYQDLYKLLRSLCDNVTDMIWAKDLDKRYIFVNKAIAERLLLATDTDEPIGKDDLFFATRQREFHPDNPRWHTFGECCQDSDQVILDELTAKRFDEYGNVNGNLLYLEVFKAPFWDERGNLIGTVGCGRDVTEAKAQERERELLYMDNEVKNQELMAISEMLKNNVDDLTTNYNLIYSIIDNLPFAIAWKDKEGIYRGCNKRYAAIFGFNKEEIINSHFTKILPSYLIEKAIQSDKEAIETGKVKLDTRIQCPQGKILDVTFYKVTYNDECGNIAGTVVSIYNKERGE